MRLLNGKTPLRQLDGSGAAEGDVPVWDKTRWVPGTAASPALWVSASASDPPPNGEPFWYRTDLTC